MKRISSFTIAFIIITINLCACSSGSKDSSKTGHDSLPEEKNRVETVVIQREDFTKEVVSNGKLAAILKAELYFGTDEIIKQINYRNGQSVAKGTVLAALDDEALQFDVKDAKYALLEAEIERKSDLISMGYRNENDNVSDEHLSIANIKSGYNDAKLSLDEANYALSNATLKTPFDGKVEGITQKTYEKADLSEPFCTLINDRRFSIEIPLLETEFNKVKIGQEVTVSPIAGAQEAIGKITEINPRVDENGLVWIKAEVNNPGNYLEGMNVKISIKKAVKNQLVVPKHAVVLRQNKEVLFRYTKGTAYWTYVNILDENEKQYSVEAADGATLDAGDTVIVSNNLNLAHESEVEIE